MKERIIEVGKKHGRWTVLSFAGLHDKRACWLCRCSCGTERVVVGKSLRAGISKSCGCLQREATAKANHLYKSTHGMRGTRTYTSWSMLRKRCLNPKEVGYRHYGGRGITVCERWRSFANFYADMGERPAGKTIDRINNNGNYEPGNCRWATPFEQRHNRRAA